MFFSTRVIGITGGVGAGKSTVLHALERKCRCRIIVSDDVGNEVKKKGQPCYDKLVELLGNGILGADGEIDKKAMAARIFGDKALLEQVNGILHPAVNGYIHEEIRRERSLGRLEYLFVEAALLIENGYCEIVDEMWYIHTDEAVRRERLRSSRGYSDEKIYAILKNQLSEDQFRAHADFVIDNNVWETAEAQIDAKLSADLAERKAEGNRG